MIQQQVQFDAFRYMKKHYDPQTVQKSLENPVFISSLENIVDYFEQKDQPELPPVEESTLEAGKRRIREYVLDIARKDPVNNIKGFWRNMGWATTIAFSYDVMYAGFALLHASHGFGPVLRELGQTWYEGFAVATGIFAAKTTKWMYTKAFGRDYDAALKKREDWTREKPELMALVQQRLDQRETDKMEAHRQKAAAEAAQEKAPEPEKPSIFGLKELATLLQKDESPADEPVVPQAPPEVSEEEKQRQRHQDLLERMRNLGR